MDVVTSTEFTRNPRAVFDRVLATGESTAITRHGEPVVKVTPMAKTLSGAEFVALGWGQGSSTPDPTWLADCQSNATVEAMVDPWQR